MDSKSKYYYKDIIFANIFIPLAIPGLGVALNTTSNPQSEESTQGSSSTTSTNPISKQFGNESLYEEYIVTKLKDAVIDINKLKNQEASAKK